jgi:ATP-dependent DNA helicase RecG
LQYEKGTLHWEREIAKDATMEDLDEELLQQWKESVGGTGSIVQLLLDNKLATKNQNDANLSNAAVVVFGKNPSALLGNKAAIRIVHYAGISPQRTGKPNFVRPPFTIDGPLLRQVQMAFDYISVVRPVQLLGAHFRQRKIPDYALQEAITNAVIHRDYSIAKYILVSIFDDRVEVESPGWFPGHVTPRNILDERFSRNPIIEQTASRLPDAPNLDIGEGVDRMFEEMDRHHLYHPRYAPRRKFLHSVHLTLYNVHRRTEWDAVEQYLSEHETIGNADVCALTGLSTLQASELLKEWVGRGFLSKIPGGGKKYARYALPEDDYQTPQQLSLF